MSTAANDNPRDGVLETCDDEGFRQRDWVARRLAFWIFTCILLAAMLGLFGGGPLSRVVVRNKGTEFRCERFARSDCATEIVFRKNRVTGHEVIVELPHQFAEAVEPRDGGNVAMVQEVNGRGTSYHFTCTEGESAEIRIVLRYRSAGLREGEAVIDGEAVPLWTLVYP